VNRRLSLDGVATPAPGTAVRLTASIEWLRLPLPGALRHINVWLLDDGDGCTLVDTGMNLPDVRAAWQGPLAAVLAGRPLRRIICTHHHPDHAGLAAWLAERHGARVWMTAPEHDLLVRAYGERQDPAVRAARFAAFERDGLAVDEGNRGVLAGAGYLSVMSGLPADVGLLQAGQVLEAGGIAWSLLELRGHTDGQLLLHAPAEGLLIAGDQVLPKISSNIGIYPERRDLNPLQSYLDSFAVLDELAPEPWVLPSHGEPFQGLRARLDVLRGHHRARLEALLALCRSPVTAAEAATGLYRGAIDPLNRMLALGETLAHLALLEAGGRVRVGEGPDGTRRFVAVAGADPGG
jgi:glyoxylase-like metal-dependent hydrolase (beta-lactamase superfamily II)